jgi:hypothetical protein
LRLTRHEQVGGGVRRQIDDLACPLADEQLDVHFLLQEADTLRRQKAAHIQLMLCTKIWSA